MHFTKTLRTTNFLLLLFHHLHKQIPAIQWSGIANIYQYIKLWIITTNYTLNEERYIFKTTLIHSLDYYRISSTKKKCITINQRPFKRQQYFFAGSCLYTTGPYYGTFSWTIPVLSTFITVHSVNNKRFSPIIMLFLYWYLFPQLKSRFPIGFISMPTWGIAVSIYVCN